MTLTTNYYWKIPVQLKDRVSTSDGFTGIITAGEKGLWKVKYDAPIHILKKFKKTQYGWYKLKDLHFIQP